MRVLGVDMGQRRIGLALSDPEGLFASPLRVIEREGGQADLEEIVRTARDYEAERIVVGIPINLRGEWAVAAQNVQQEIEQLRCLSHVPVEIVDERLTTAAADRSLASGGVGREARRGVVDKVAAALLLQTYLDKRRRENS